MRINLKNISRQRILMIAVLVFAFAFTATATFAALTMTATQVSSDGALTITGAAASTWSTSAGALTVDSAAALNLGTTNSTSVSIGSGTGSATLNDAVVFAANKGVTVTAGTSAFDFSGGTGVFKTSTGAVTIGSGAVSVTGATTHTAKVKIGTDATTNAISLVNTAGSDFGLETYTKLATDMAGGWYSGSNSYMTVPVSQTGNTSVFGSISELDLGSAITFSSSNAGAMWADLEILGATDIGASSEATPSYSGAVVATVIAPATMTVPANRHLAGVIVDSNLTAGYTNNGVVSGIMIRKSSGKDVWPVGLRIQNSSTTTGIDIGTATTGLLVSGATTTALSVTGATSTADIALYDGSTIDTGVLSGSEGDQTLKSIYIVPTGSAAVAGVGYHQLMAISGNFGDPTKRTYGLVAGFSRDVATTAALETDTGFDLRVTNNEINNAGYKMQGAYIKAKNDGAPTASVLDTMKGLYVEAQNEENATVGTIIGVDIGVLADGTETTATGLNIRTLTGGDRSVNTFKDISLQYGETIDNITNGTVKFTNDAGTITGENHGIDLTYTGTLPSGGGMVGINSAVTTAGTAGTWASGVYAKVVQGATKNVNGYLSGAEFEVVNTAASVSDWFPLVLNANSTNNGSHSSYIALRNYGTTDLNSLLWIPTAGSEHTIGTASATSLISDGADHAATHYIRIIVEGTPMWILATTTAP